MTAEEIDIVVNASVEKAVKEFEKLLPAVQKTVNQVTKKINSTDFKSLKTNVQRVVNEVKTAFEPMNKIKINGKMFELKNIKGYSKEVMKLKGDLQDLKKLQYNQAKEPIIKIPEQLKNEIKQIEPEIKNITDNAKDTINKMDFTSIKTKMQQAVQFVKTKIANLIKSNKNNELAIKVNNQDAQKQISQIEKQIDSLQKKITGRQLKLDILTNQIEQRKSDIKNKYTPDGVSKDDSRMQPFLNQKIGSDKELQKMIQQAQKLKEEINNDTRAIQQLKAETQNIKPPKTGLFNGLANQIRQAVTHTKGLKQSFNQIPSITQKVTNNIKGMGTHLKGGLRHVFKYAGALLSIRGIYGILRNSASSWLSSQNAGAQQLSANIEYMKYAMRKCISTNNSICNKSSISINESYSKCSLCFNRSKYIC